MTADMKNVRLHRQLQAILMLFYRVQEPNALHDIPIQLGTFFQ
jgi:hypothetical protein